MLSLSARDAVRRLFTGATQTFTGADGTASGEDVLAPRHLLLLRLLPHPRVQLHTKHNTQFEIIKEILQHAQIDLLASAGPPAEAECGKNMKHDEGCAKKR